MTVLDLIADTVQLVFAGLKLHKLRRRVIPYVSEISGIFEQFNQILIHTHEEKEHVLREMENYIFTINMNAANSEESETRVFPLPPKQRYQAIYDMISGIVSQREDMLALGKDEVDQRDPRCYPEQAFTPQMRDTRKYDSAYSQMQVYKHAAGKAEQLAGAGEPSFKSSSSYGYSYKRSEDSGSKYVEEDPIGNVMDRILESARGI